MKKNKTQVEFESLLKFYKTVKININYDSIRNYIKKVFRRGNKKNLKK